MADISDFHPLMQKAMQTGTMPAHEEIARATGKTPEEVSGALEETTSTGNEAEPDAEPEHPDAQRFRDRYHRLVDAMTAEWLDEHPEYGKRVPVGVKERIADDCNRQIQHAWRLHCQRLAEEQDEQDTC